MKKLFSLILAILVFSTVFVGCSQPAGEVNIPDATTQPTEAPTEAQKEVSLLHPTWMYELTHDDGRVSYFSFNDNNTGLAFYADVVGTAQTFEYNLDKENLNITMEDGTQYSWTYDYDKENFIPGSGVIDTKTAADAFTVWYDNGVILSDTSGDFQSQIEMTTDAGSNSEMWKSILAVIYDYLIGVLPQSEAESLASDQNSWTDERQAEIDKAVAEVGGGSMAPMIAADTSARITKERVEELIDMIPAP